MTKPATPKKTSTEKKETVIKKTLKPDVKTTRAVKPAKAVIKTKEPEKQKKLTPREKKIRDIREKLITQRNILLAEAEETLNSLPGQTIFPDLGDQASAEIDRNLLLRLRGREQRLLKKIDSAIEKIDSGTFGICEVCGQEIDIKRIEARPVTTMCIHCKTEQEEEEKLRRQ
ncbi:MAG: hypothetical protein OHK0032_07220 [Thermodesulfovibrionales bacterium]